MSDNIISYIEMCRREGTSLQQGMNFGIGGNHSVILMSVRRNAPYRDRLEDGTILVYEGHDQPKGPKHPNPKVVESTRTISFRSVYTEWQIPRGSHLYKSGTRPPERVRVYEKIQPGIWSYNGVFHLIDSWRERDKYREVFKYRLVAVEGDESFDSPPQRNIQRCRVIPTSVKLTVWKRDGGKCVICGATDELHFDHDLPWSKGGTSITAENVQLLCVRHNLQKHDHIV